MHEASVEVERNAYIIDDDDEFRRSLVLLLGTGGWQVRSFSSVPEFLRRAATLSPGALLLDIRMPEIGGLDLLESSEHSLLNFGVIVVSGHGDVHSVVRSLKAGAVDFVEKPFDGPELLAMLNTIYGKLLDRIDTAKREAEAQERVASLSAREVDVLSGLLTGGSYKEIARQLGISDRTVEMYRNNMVRKLGVSSTAEAIHVGILGRVSVSEQRRCA